MVITFSDVAAEALQEARSYAESIVDTVREPLLVLDEQVRVLSANHSFYATFRVSKNETEGRSLYELGDNDWDIPKLRTLMREILPKRRVLNDFEMTHDFESIGARTMVLNARVLHRGGGRPRGGQQRVWCARPSLRYSTSEGIGRGCKNLDNN